MAWSGNCGNSDFVYDACLRYNGAESPTNLPRVAVSPVAVMFSDGDPNDPYVYRERLTPATVDGYGGCLAIPLQIRRPIK